MRSVVARRVSHVAGKTPGGFGTGFNFPKGDPRTLASLAIGSSDEEENVTLRGGEREGCCGREAGKKRKRERDRDRENGMLSRWAQQKE